MPYSQNVFGRTVNTKWSGRPVLLDNHLHSCGVRNVDEIVTIIIIIIIQRGRLVSSKTLFLFADYVFS